MIKNYIISPNYIMLNWLIPASIGAILIGLYNLLLEGSGKSIGSNRNVKSVYMMMVMVCAGIYAALILTYFHFADPKSIAKASSSVQDGYWKVLLPGLLCVSYMLANLLALSEGGGIVMGVINLNVFVTLIGGALLYGDKINAKIIVSLIGAFALISYATYQSSLLK
tara:strand:+ start:1636 stop:2136 length:501 start_codon:yes stop_codon:yes gene_type:complete